MINTAVRLAQQQLAALGFDIGATGADGALGPKTRAAISAYQKAIGLPVSGMLTDATLGELTKPPRPNLRPQQVASDVLNASPRPASTTPPMPQMRSAANVPPPDQLGAGNSNVMPRLRENIPVPTQAVDNFTMRGPPPGAIPPRVGYGTSAQPPGTSRDGLMAAQLANARQMTGNPDAQFNPGTSFDQMQRLGMQSGSRTTEGMQRGFAPTDQGGMGLGRFPQQSPNPMMTGGIPDFTAGGNAGNGLPPNPAPQDNSAPNEPQIQQAPPEPLVAGNQPQGFTPTPDNPGVGFPGQPPARDFGAMAGDAGSNLGGWLSGLMGGQQAQAAPQQSRGFSWVTPPDLPLDPGLPDAAQYAASKERMKQMLWQMLMNGSQNGAPR